MFRLLPKFIASIGLAIAFVVLAFGTRPGGRIAEAAPSVTVTGSTVGFCGVPMTVSAIVTDPTASVLGLPVTFSSAQGTFLSPTTSTGLNGIASTSFTPSIFSGTAVVSAAVAGQISSTPLTISVSCGTGASFCNPLVPATCVNTACTPLLTTGCVNPCGPQFTSGLFGTGTNVFGTNVFGTNVFGTNVFSGGFVPSACAPTAIITPNLVDSIKLLAPASASCGGAVGITGTVTFGGLFAADGTVVNFTSTLGQIQASDSTIRGRIDASLNIPIGASGTAVVTATSGNARDQVSIPVTCAAPPPRAAIPAAAPAAVAPPAVVPIAPSAAGIRPPSTGDAGLRALFDENRD